MQNVSFDTITVPAIGGNPATLAKAAGLSLRLLVNNVGPTVMFISQATTDLQPVPTTGSYRVFPGEQHVFVVAPKQSVYAISAAAGGLLSISLSEALPLDTHRA